jgi:hypothetical protein
VGPRAGLDGCEREHFLASPGFDPRTVQPVANRYTAYAILAPGRIVGESFIEFVS